MDKYEYLTDEDLGLKPRTTEQAKFEYSPLGTVFTKGLNKDDQKDGFFKRLKNIEGKNEEQLKAIEDQGKKQLEEIKNINLSSKPLKTISFFSTISEEAKKLMVNIKQIDDWLDSAQLVCTKTDGTSNDFNKFMFPLKFTLKIYHRNLMVQKAEDDQHKLEIKINKLNSNYNPRNQTKIKEKDETLESAKKLLGIGKEIINAFKKGIFPYIDEFQEETDEDTDEKTNTTDMPELESEESDSSSDIEGKGLKILTPNQMLSRLPISLAQLQARNNSQKLKNEIRQLLFSLYRPKNMTKQVYDNFIKYI